jgi:hypothetical protein
LKVAIGGAKASIAAAVIGPIPGMLLKTLRRLIVLGASPQSLVELRNLDIKAGNMLEVSLA